MTRLDVGKLDEVIDHAKTIRGIYKENSWKDLSFESTRNLIPLALDQIGKSLKILAEQLKQLEVEEAVKK